MMAFILYLSEFIVYYDHFIIRYHDPVGTFGESFTEEDIDFIQYNAPYRRTRGKLPVYSATLPDG